MCTVISRRCMLMSTLPFIAALPSAHTLLFLNILGLRLWMSSKCISLSSAKTRLIWFGTHQQLFKFAWLDERLTFLSFSTKVPDVNVILYSRAYSCLMSTILSGQLQSPVVWPLDVMFPKSFSFQWLVREGRKEIVFSFSIEAIQDSHTELCIGLRAQFCTCPRLSVYKINNIRTKSCMDILCSQQKVGECDDVKKIMMSWVEKSGFPMIKVELLPGNRINATQKQFLDDPPSTPDQM